MWIETIEKSRDKIDWILSQSPDWEIIESYHDRFPAADRDPATYDEVAKAWQNIATDHGKIVYYLLRAILAGGDW